MKFGLLVFIFTLTACVTTPPTERPDIPETPRFQNLSDEEIRERIGLGLPEDGLGFSQKTYNPCSLGIEPLRAGTCGPEYFGLVGIQIRCRHSRGTVESVRQKSSLPDPNLRWEVGSLKGRERLDEDGFGVIYMRSRSSLKHKKIKIFNRGRILYMSLKDLRSVVVPVDWCL